MERSDELPFGAPAMAGAKLFVCCGFPPTAPNSVWMTWLVILGSCCCNPEHPSYPFIIRSWFMSARPKKLGSFLSKFAFQSILKKVVVDGICICTLCFFF